MPKLSNFRLLTDELQDWLIEADDETQASYLILGTHPDSSVHWIVNCLHPEFYIEFEHILGEYRAVSTDALDDFMALADELGYTVLFEDDPAPIFAAQSRLDDPPPFKLNSTLDNTIGGFLPFQLREFNRLKDKDYGLAVWSTGTGKTVFAGSLLRYHRDEYDLAFVVVKSNNKVNTQRKLKKLMGLDALVVKGDKERREKTYAQALDLMKRGEHPILVLNYEKFKTDFTEKGRLRDDAPKPGVKRVKDYTVANKTWGRDLFLDRNLLFIWDEMPMKLKNRKSQLYHGVSACLYELEPPKVRADRFRPARARQYMLSATPIENDPSDVFNCLRLMDGAATFGPVKAFETEYVKSWSPFDPHKPYRWHGLGKIHLKIAPFTSMVDKRDPEIAAMFPRVIEDPIYIDWHDKDRKIYDLLTGKISESLLLEDDPNPLALMTVLQMVCDAPSILSRSAQKRELFEEQILAFVDDDDAKIPNVMGSELALEIVERVGELDNNTHTKLLKLDEILTVRHPDEKIIVFTVFGDMFLPTLSERFSEQGIEHVVYAGTDKQKQDAQDRFKEDPDCRVFLSSDAGSDSIDLEEASVTVDYDVPFKYSRIIQRRNRMNRVTSKHLTNYCYTLLMTDSVEDRRVEIVATKLGYHEGIFHGISEKEIASARLDKGDLVYILTGHDPNVQQ